MRSIFSLLVAASLITLVGCGGATARKAPAEMGIASDKAAGEGKPDQPPLMPRKIIYTADVQLTVEDFGTAEQALRQLVREQKDGYVAKSDISNSPGSPRSGKWTVRIPAGQLESFLEALAKLGEVQSQSVGSQDVTEEFYDVQARIKNKKMEERRLQDILEKSTGKLEDVLKVEARLSDVRGDIERMEGRLKLLENQTTLTAVTIRIQERKSTDSLAFGTTIGRTFSGSIDLLVSFFKMIVVVIVAVAPWLAVLAAVVVPLVYWIRALVRGRQPAAVIPVDGPSSASSA